MTFQQKYEYSPKTNEIGELQTLVMPRTENSTILSYRTSREQMAATIVNTREFILLN